MFISSYICTVKAFTLSAKELSIFKRLIRFISYDEHTYIVGNVSRGCIGVKCIGKIFGGLSYACVLS